VKVCLHCNKQGGGDTTQKILCKDQTQVPAFWYFKEGVQRIIRSLATSLLAMWYMQLQQNSVTANGMCVLIFSATFV